MRILQLIDSLAIGGAEKMAVNFANTLAKKIEFSGLVATRQEGKLIAQLDSGVDYFFLNKKSAVDIAAILRLRKYCRKHQIEFIHAHSTSSFTAFLLKMICPKVKIIWHDHYGLSEFLNARNSFLLKFISRFFIGIIGVNNNLKNWAETKLNCRNVIYLANFTSFSSNEKVETELFGIEGKRILCLANLRPQKNHFLLIEIAKKLQQSHSDWTFHLIGKDFKDEYSNKVKEAIKEKVLEEIIYIYGSRNDIQNIINSCDISILTSESEGLPVALLEYGLLKKPVVVTEVGEISSVIKNKVNGFTVENNDAEAFYKSLILLIENEDLRLNFGNSLYNTIIENHSEISIINKYLNWVNKL